MINEIRSEITCVFFSLFSSFLRLMCPPPSTGRKTTAQPKKLNKRETETARQADREREAETERQRQSQRDRDRQTETKTQRETETDRERHRDREAKQKGGRNGDDRRERWMDGWTVYCIINGLSITILWVNDDKHD